MTMQELEELYNKYYNPPLSSPTQRDIYNCLLQQGRSDRRSIAEYSERNVTPYFIEQLEKLVDNNVIIKEGNKPMIYDIKFRPMEYL